MKKLFRAEVITLSSQFDIANNHIVGCKNNYFDLGYSTVDCIYESRAMFLGTYVVSSKHAKNCFLLLLHQNAVR